MVKIIGLARITIYKNYAIFYYFDNYFIIGFFLFLNLSLLVILAVIAVAVVMAVAVAVAANKLGLWAL